MSGSLPLKYSQDWFKNLMRVGTRRQVVDLPLLNQIGGQNYFFIFGLNSHGSCNTVVRMFLALVLLPLKLFLTTLTGLIQPSLLGKMRTIVYGQ